MNTFGRFVFLLLIGLVAAGCSGATLSAEDVEGFETESTPPSILANLSDEEGGEGDVSADEGDASATTVSTDLSSPPSSAEDTATQPATTAGATGTTAGSAQSPEATTSDSVAPVASPQAADADGFLPPGSPLPSDADCKAQVQSAPAVRAANAGPNATAGGPSLSGPEFERVTGNMTGSTDEILQWAACKWGLPADIARAQAATETWWRQGFLGDWTTTSADCAPGHSLGSGDRPGECPQSIGLLQIKYKFFQDAFPGASDSTAYSVDYAYAVWRNCFEGRQEWLNDSERGKDYAAGDGWGCIGRWFAGQWYTPPATDYIAHVREALDSKVWTSADFIAEG